MGSARAHTVLAEWVLRVHARFLRNGFCACTHGSCGMGSVWRPWTAGAPEPPARAHTQRRWPCVNARCCKDGGLTSAARRSNAPLAVPAVHRGQAWGRGHPRFSLMCMLPRMPLLGRCGDPAQQPCRLSAPSWPSFSEAAFVPEDKAAYVLASAVTLLDRKPRASLVCPYFRQGISMRGVLNRGHAAGTGGAGVGAEGECADCSTPPGWALLPVPGQLLWRAAWACIKAHSQCWRCSSEG